MDPPRRMQENVIIDNNNNNNNINNNIQTKNNTTETGKKDATSDKSLSQTFKVLNESERSTSDDDHGF